MRLRDLGITADDLRHGPPCTDNQLYGCPCRSTIHDPAPDPEDEDDT